ncbi:hypothetical protein ACFX2J_027522 [Malus domestica]
MLFGWLGLVRGIHVLRGEEAKLRSLFVDAIVGGEWVKRVVLVRHWQSTWNKEGQIQGSSNFSMLTKKNEDQESFSLIRVLRSSGISLAKKALRCGIGMASHINLGSAGDRR